MTSAVLVAQEPPGDRWVVPAGELWARLLDPWALIQFLTMALVVAWIAGRLLGATKRSWRAVFITAVSGWLVALAVSATIVRGDLDHPSWPLIGPPMLLLFIMLATVVLEVWVKPGKRWVPSGLTIPHPIRLIKLPICGSDSARVWCWVSSDWRHSSEGSGVPGNGMSRRRSPREPLTKTNT